MKYQLQFAGAKAKAAAGRASAPPPKLKQSKRTGLLLVLLLAVGAVVGWQYFGHRTGKAPAPAAPPVAETTTAATAATSATTAATTAAAATQTEPKVVTDVKGQKMMVFDPKATVTAPVAIAPPAVRTRPKPQPVMVRPIQKRPPLTPEEKLDVAAKKALENMLIVAGKYPDSYGFRAEDAFSNVRLGQAIPVYTIDPRDRATYAAGQPVQPLLKPMPRWVFPVYPSEGHYICCMLQVTQENGEYVPGPASKLLGQAWNKILERWPADQGYTPRLVVNPAIPGYYFTIPELGTPNITDIIRLQEYATDPSPANVILASWR